MKYLEMVGMPRSGKTTLLRSFRSRSSRGKGSKVVLSEDWEMVLRRLGIVDSAFLGSTMRESTHRRGTYLKRQLYDGWHMGTLASFPKLFAQVLACLESVSTENRQREILLNYWRSRASLYLDVSQSVGTSFCLVDEGFSQSVLSTMARMSSPKDQRFELGGSLLACLPTERVIVVLNTPIQSIERRLGSGRGLSSNDMSRRIEELAFIVQQQKILGRDVFELDGSQSVDELCKDLGAQITEAAERQ